MRNDRGEASSAWADDSTTLFASRAWFDRWFEAFHPSEHGEWPAPERPSSYRIPYQVEDRSIGAFRLRTVSGAVNAYTPQFDLLGTGAPILADLRRMLKDLDASVLVLPLVARGSRLVRALNGGNGAIGTFLDDCEAAPLIDCTGSFDAYLATRSPSRRTEWLDKEQRLARSGGQLDVLSTWESVSGIFDELLEVEASGWKGRKGTSIRQVPEARGFFEAVCRDLGAAGKLRVFVLRRESRVIAFKIATLHAGRLSSLKTGYLQAFAKDSPGAVLQLKVARWCFEEPKVDVFDFLGPATPTKLLWSTRIEPLYTMYVFRPTPAGALAWSRWSAGPRARQWLLRRLKRQPAAPVDAPKLRRQGSLA